MTPAELTARGLRVKPLEWDDWGTRHRIVVAATTATGVYRVTQRHFPEGMFTLEKPNNDVANFPTLEAAIAAANAHDAAQVAARIEVIG